MEDLIIALEQLGLTEIQVKVYLTLLQLKEATIQEIVDKSKIKRTTVYYSLNLLVSRNLITFVDQGWHRKYFAENPKKVLFTFRERQENIKDQEKKFLEVLPELASLYTTKVTQPKVAYYDGIPGIKQLYEDTLITLKKGDELLAYVTDSSIKHINDYLKDYVARRVKKGIKGRGITVDTPLMRQYLKNNKIELRTAKTVDPKKFPLENEINIYANKVIILTFEPEPFGVLIESKAIANTQRAIFEMAWRGIG